MAKCLADSEGKDSVVVKAQVLAGGRGKGMFDNGFKGGVHMASRSAHTSCSMSPLPHPLPSVNEVENLAGKMLGAKLITKQTGAGGRLCNSVYICERKFARREFYLAVLMDRASQGPVIVSSSQGGMDIEERSSAVWPYAPGAERS